MEKSSWIQTYENTEKVIEKSVKENKEFTNAAFFSLGIAGVGAAMIAASRFEPVLAAGASALVTGMVMGVYFFNSKSKNNEMIEVKQRMLDKLYKLMPPQDQDLIDQKKEKAVNAIDAIREKNNLENTTVTNSLGRKLV